jgi:hypothetical protein
MTAKKPYQKPEVKKVDLRPEEAVLTGCKNSSGTWCIAGAGDSGCPICSIFGG